MKAVLLESLSHWWPEVALSIGALLTFLIGAFGKRSKPAQTCAWVSLVAAAFLLTRVPVPPDSATFFGLIVCDPFSLAFRWLALGTAALTLLMAAGSTDDTGYVRAEYFGIILLLTLGLMLVAESNHLLMAYLSIELVSLSSYLLVGFLNDDRSAEAALKYLLYGALASGIMLFGMSLLFGLTGQLDFPGLTQAFTALPVESQSAALMAVVFMLVGVGFKISMVPFHMWTPDAYEGAPVPVAALLSVGPKAAGLALLARLFQVLAPAWPALEPLMLSLTILTMTFGNLAALGQTNVKRLLAYSTIGQVGYLLIGCIVQTALGRQALLVYLFAYLFMNMGAFACVTAVVNESRNESIDAFAGLSRRSPVLAALTAIFLFSLAGIPPLLGFFGKFLIFGAAIEAQYPWLAIAGVVNSALALYYYVKIVRAMYLVKTEARGSVYNPLPLRLAVGLCAIATVVLGLFPGRFFDWLRHATVLNLL